MPLTSHGRAADFAIGRPPFGGTAARGRGTGSAGRAAKANIAASILSRRIGELRHDAGFRAAAGDDDIAEALRADADKLQDAVDVLERRI